MLEHYTTEDREKLEDVRDTVKVLMDTIELLIKRIERLEAEPRDVWIGGSH